MKLSGTIIAALSGFAAPVVANTEKAIFLGPRTSNMPTSHPNLDDLRVDTLIPRHWTLRTHLEAEFPSAESKFGRSTWLVLDQLTEGQRYELRVCWAATQPTDFRINVYELDQVFEAPELITDLSDYSWSRQDGVARRSKRERYNDKAQKKKEEEQVSVLLLQIQAAADYYTTNRTLMANVPPVRVDIILDPYIFNIIPRTLVPAVGYIVVIGVVTWYIANWVANRLREISQDPGQTKKQQ